VSNRSGVRDLGGMAVAAALIVLGGFVFHDTTTYVDVDSKVFPRTVALVMIVCSVIVIVRNLLWPATAGEAPAPASVPRRLGLVAAMLGSVLVMPWVGILVSGLGAFAALMALAMFDPWTRFRLVVYPLVAVAMVVAFYVLFGQVLQVPLPVGSLFE